jgi:putative peptidoglycan lipid II flippase
MSERLAEGRPDLYKQELQTVLRVIVWLALPVTVIAFFLRGYLVSFIINGGDTLIASIFGILAIVITFRSIYYIAAKSFYAHQDTKTPLYVSFFTIALNITLAVWFTMGLGMGPYGLAWAAAIVAVVEVSILLTIMTRRIPGLFGMAFVGSIARMASAAGFTALVTYILVSFLPLSADDQSFYASFPKFIVIVLASGLAYLFFSYLLKLEEVGPILTRAKKIIFYRNR